MIDNGMGDEKIIAIPFNDPTYNNYTSIDQLPRHIFDEMKHFFTVYKELEQKETDIDALGDENEAMEIIDKAIDNYINKFQK